MKTTVIEGTAAVFDKVKFMGRDVTPIAYADRPLSPGLEADTEYEGRVVAVSQAECGPGIVSKWVVVEIEQGDNWWFYDIEDTAGWENNTNSLTLVE